MALGLSSLGFSAFKMGGSVNATLWWGGGGGDYFSLLTLLHASIGLGRAEKVMRRTKSRPGTGGADIPGTEICT